MSAYNRLVVDETCPSCGNVIKRGIQFKYGDVWQHDYRLGDSLIWDRNNIGDPGHEEVLALGYPEKCPNCGDQPDWTYDVLITGDVLRSVTTAPARTEMQRYSDNAHFSIKRE